MECKLREFKMSDRNYETTSRDNKAKDRKPEDVAVDVGMDCIVRWFL
jgi:hypothetical protein